MTQTLQEERVLELLIAQLQQVPAEEIRKVKVSGVRESYSSPIVGGYIVTISASGNPNILDGQKMIETTFSIEIDSPERERVFYYVYTNHSLSPKKWHNNLRETYLTLKEKYLHYDKIVSRTDALGRYQDKLNALEKALLRK